MKSTTRRSHALLALLAIAAIILFSAPAARAQTATSGAVEGYVWEFGTQNADPRREGHREEQGDRLHPPRVNRPEWKVLRRHPECRRLYGHRHAPGLREHPELDRQRGDPHQLDDPGPRPAHRAEEARRGADCTDHDARHPDHAACDDDTPPTTSPTPPAGTPPGAGAGSRVRGSGSLVNTTNASRGQNFDRRLLLSVPLPGIRSFDDLAFLAPGVAPPPQAIGRLVGPGLGPGVGTSGQFSVNGLRSRANNFTIDGSDNNDEEVGVRRQGFTSLVPQPIESLQEYQITTLLAEPQFGRNLGAQVNAVSRSGGNDLHGTAVRFSDWPPAQSA